MYQQDIIKGSLRPYAVDGMQNLKKRFGLVLGARRKFANLTQERLADIAGVSLETVARLETGSIGASFEMIEKLATALRVDEADLFSLNINNKNAAKLMVLLTELDEDELKWVDGIVTAALTNRPSRSIKSARRKF